MVNQPIQPRPQANANEFNANNTRSRRRFRNFVFTLNNPTEVEKTRLSGYLTELPPAIRYIVFQTERGDGEGTSHIQGYIELRSKKEFSTCKNYVSIRAHIENRRGSAEQAAAYCMKVDTRIEGIHGENGERSGKRSSKVKEAIQAIKDGKSMKEIRTEFSESFVYHGRGLQTLYEGFTKHRNWAMEIIILFGSSGSGKSYTANSLYPNAYNVPWPSGGRWWWPGYDGEETVIMDEFRHQIKMDVMLKLFDRYAFNIESKGKNMKFRSKRLVITTNINPKDWYPKVQDKSMLKRRIVQFSTVYEMNTEFDPSTMEEPVKVQWDLTDFEFTVHQERNWSTFAHNPPPVEGGFNEGYGTIGSVPPISIL